MYNKENFYDMESNNPTQYNSNIATIMRMDKLEHSFIAAFLDADYSYALHVLELLYSEVDFKLKPEESKIMDQEIESIKLDIPKAMAKHNVMNKTFYSYPEMRTQVHKRIMQLRRALGRIKYKTGMGMTDSDDPRLAVAE